MFNGKKKGAYLNSLIIRSRGEQLAVRAPRHVAQTQLVTRDLENKFYQYTTAIIENMINNKERERVGDNYNNLYENDMGLKMSKAAILSVKKEKSKRSHHFLNLSVLGVPNSNGSVRRGRGDIITARGEFHRGDSFHVALQTHLQGVVG